MFIEHPINSVFWWQIWKKMHSIFSAFLKIIPFHTDLSEDDTNLSLFCFDHKWRLMLLWQCGAGGFKTDQLKYFTQNTNSSKALMATQMMMPTLVKPVTTNSETNKVRENVVASGISSYHSLLYEQQWSLNRLCVHCEFEQFHYWFYAFCINLCKNIPCMIVVHQKATKLQECKALQLKEDKSAS